jgi:endoglucanase
MRNASYEFLKAILETPSPSGFEQPVQRIVREYAASFSKEVTTDVHGNVITAVNPRKSPRVMLAGHCDQIGMMVNHFDDSGHIFFKPIGGIDPSVVPGSRVIVHTRHGPVDGVIGRKPIHTLKQEERGAKIELREMWVDIGAKNKKEAQQVVRVGDPVTFQLQLVHLGQDLVACAGFDNKCGTFVVMEALRICSAKKVSCGLFAVSTVQEEIGIRGAKTSCYGIDPYVGIAVDVTHATDYPDIDKRVNGDIKVGAGPTIPVGPNINPVLEDLLVRTAKAKRINHQMEAAPNATGTDANAIQLTRAGVATALIGIPNRYMHTQVEVVSLSDLESAAKLIAEAVGKINTRSDFTPS